jgi:hypothetical protein
MPDLEILDSKEITLDERRRLEQIVGTIIDLKQ